jgi:hypothetical protein
MNHCQNCYSCFSCCGLFNFKLKVNELYDLLKDRTTIFRSIYNASFICSFPREELLEYRKEREKIEDKIEKYDGFVYVCPFLGFINKENNKIGCMIHPSLTGEEKSQDISFYGSAICLSYNCRVKEMDYSLIYLKLLQKVIPKLLEDHKNDVYEVLFLNKKIKDSFLNHLLFSRLMGDYIFYSFIKKYFDLSNFLKNESHFLMFKKLCLLRLKKNFYVTSFEINYERFIESNFDESFKKIFLNEDTNNNLVMEYKKILKLC